ncbi:MAG: Jag N-terminal domain-containing protein [Oscillospiraceae bacterium]|jgi:spoIIIJ-associated protein|nr:Jag N-terminal domain-containing protein [Oscillospiraceae bacterium]
METYLEKTGRTIDAAIQAALDELHLDRDQVTVEVLEKPKTGFLGIGGALARVRVSYVRSRAAKAEEFLTGLLTRLQSAATVRIEEAADGTLSIELLGSGLGFLIGHRGDTLDAIQHLVNYAVNRGDEHPARVTIDAENYRAKRVEALQRLAKKMAAKALKYRKNLSLEPMNSYERHIIHAALQDMEGVSTRSIGVEPHRRVVVVCEGVVRPTGPRPPRSDKPRQFGGRPQFGERPPFGGRTQGGERPPFGGRTQGGERPPFGGRTQGGERPPFGGRSQGGERPPFGGHTQGGGRPQGGGFQGRQGGGYGRPDRPDNRPGGPGGYRRPDAPRPGGGAPRPGDAPRTQPFTPPGNPRPYDRISGAPPETDDE